MKKNIVQDLQKIKDDEIKEIITSDPANEVKLLVDSDNSTDLIIMRSLGKLHSLSRAETALGKKLEIERLESKLGDGVFTADQIKQLCIKYDMRLLPSKYYKGNLDMEVVHKIREFGKKYEVEINPATVESHFFVLGPTESFNLERVRMRRYSDDPAMFYKIDETHYRLIHKWGADFTLFRLIKGLFKKNREWRLLLVFLACTVMALSTLMVLDYFCHFSNWFYLLSFPAGMVARLGHMFWLNDLADEKRLYSEESWNSATYYV